MKITSKQLYAMKLHDVLIPDSNSVILRVPGGWIYGSMQGEAFVPFNNEFMEKDDDIKF